MLVYSLVPWQLAGVKGAIFVGIFTNWLLLFFQYQHDNSSSEAKC